MMPHPHRAIGSMGLFAMPRASRSCDVRRGFTLLELILSMGIAAMLALSLYMSMTIAFKAKRSAEAAVAPTRAASVATDLIGRDLQSVVKPGGTLAGPFIGMPQGSPGAASDTLEFYSLGGGQGAGSPGGAGDGLPLDEGIRRIDLEVVSDVQPPVLVRRVTRNLMAPTQVEPQDEVLCRGVQSFTIRYFDGTDWLDSWDSDSTNNELPLAVSLDVVIDTTQQDSAAAAAASPAPPRPSDIVHITKVIPIAIASYDALISAGETQQ